MPFPFWANPGLDASAALKTAEPATTSNSLLIFPPYFLRSNEASCGWNSRSGGSRQNGVPLGGLGKRMVRLRNLEILLSRSPVLEQGDLTGLPEICPMRTHSETDPLPARGRGCPPRN